jgi:hypothetical protein
LRKQETNIQKEYPVSGAENKKQLMMHLIFDIREKVIYYIVGGG